MNADHKKTTPKNPKAMLAHSITLALASGGLFTATNGIRAEEPMVLEEITVTTEKRAEKLQDVPVSVTAFSAEAIVEAGIEDTYDFINLTPNVTLEDAYTAGQPNETIFSLTERRTEVFGSKIKLVSVEIAWSSLSMRRKSGPKLAFVPFGRAIFLA
uniref:TonB-dependent Receptor Plug Domain n=1 Tax=Candidatus Kentrum sp. UNK TaxID=2126344 RepID=A0A451B2F4_9GAMM|nr:MAG: hypothetical protein BECKUNK1418G_GA0071005_11225 [Candidatus Kentron sp. UNK]VFK72460.1 MAG: hypothetical protein BECKUNK1418H_GA0071006_11165 [Candidatus Kentron sp. UNK]